MAAEQENKTNTEGVPTPSVETVEKSLYDELKASTDARISELEKDLKSEKEYSADLESQLSDYSKQLDSKAQVAGEFDYIPLMNIINEEKKTRDEIIADKKLLKLFKK